MNWYTADEIEHWTRAKEIIGENTEWFADQLNIAFRKGQQFGDEKLKHALGLLEMDPHQFSSRPCDTCKAVSAAVGHSFGCDAKRIQSQQSRKE